jgi:hypothetical protein
MQLKFSTRQLIANELNEQYTFEELAILERQLVELWHSERYDSGRGENVVSEFLWRLKDILASATYDRTRAVHKAWVNPPTPEAEPAPAPAGVDVVND